MWNVWYPDSHLWECSTYEYILSLWLSTSFINVQSNRAISYISLLNHVMYIQNQDSTLSSLQELYLFHLPGHNLYHSLHYNLPVESFLPGISDVLHIKFFNTVYINSSTWMQQKYPSSFLRFRVLSKSINNIFFYFHRTIWSNICKGCIDSGPRVCFLPSARQVNELKFIIDRINASASKVFSQLPHLSCNQPPYPIL